LSALNPARDSIKMATIAVTERHVMARIGKWLVVSGLLALSSLLYGRTNEARLPEPPVRKAPGGPRGAPVALRTFHVDPNFLGGGTAAGIPGMAGTSA